MAVGNDRRVAAAYLAVVAAIFAVLCAATSVDAPLRDVRAAEDVIRLALRGDRQTYRADYQVARAMTSGAHLSVGVSLWARPRPLLRAELSSGQLTVATRNRVAVCSDVETGPQCLKVSGSDSRHRSSDPYLAAILSGSYRVSEVAGQRIAGEPARCFALTLRRGANVVAGLGYSVLSCFAHDGIVLRSVAVHPGARDDRRAVRIVRGWARNELRRLARKYTDGTVEGLR